MVTQATELSASEQALQTLVHLENVVETGRRLNRAQHSLEEFDRRYGRIRAKLALEVVQLQGEFDLLTADRRLP